MLHRQTEVKFRDNQENRVQQYPKTPKNANANVRADFATPAPKARVALGAKSTNVHNRQFTSAKTGKRHSPITSKQLPLSLPQQQAESLSGGAKLRLEFQRALDNGDDLPDVEYCPPRPEELPYEGPDWYRRLTKEEFDSLDYEDVQRPMSPEMPPPFVPIEMAPSLSEALSKGLNLQDGHAILKPRLGRFAAPTVSAQAKMKTKTQPRSTRSTSQRTNTEPSRSTTSRTKSSAITASRDFDSLRINEPDQIEPLFLKTNDIPDEPALDEPPCPSDFEIDFDALEEEMMN